MTLAWHEHAQFPLETYQARKEVEQRATLRWREYLGTLKRASDVLHHRAGLIGVQRRGSKWQARKRKCPVRAWCCTSDAMPPAARGTSTTRRVASAGAGHSTQQAPNSSHSGRLILALPLAEFRHVQLG